MNAIIDAPHAVAGALASNRATPTARAAAGLAPAEYLSFRLGGEEYGIDILKVQEIRSYETPTRIANSPMFVMGVVNLRGVVVPIVDMRLYLGCDTAEYNALTVVIVLNIHGRVVGAVVDSVSDVIELRADEINAPPEMTTNIDAGFITGIASIDKRMLILMDIQSLMSSRSMGLLNEESMH